MMRSSSEWEIEFAESCERLQICRNEVHVQLRRALPLAVACVAHAGALCALRAVRLPPHELAVAGANVSEIELDVTELNEGHSAVVLAPAIEALRTPGREPRVGAAVAKVEPRAVAGDMGVSQPNKEAPSVEPRPSDWSFSPTAMQVDARAAVTPDLVAPKGEVRLDETPPGSRSSSHTGGLAEGLAAHDVEVGMGRGGAVLVAAESAARSSEAPLDGGATFDVVIRSDGVVTARVASADRDVDAWKRVAASLEHSVDPARIRMPASGRGWQVVVRVDAKVQLADGRDVRSLHGLRGSLAPSALESAIEGSPAARGSSAAASAPDSAGEGPSIPPPVGGALGSGRSNAGAGAAQAIVQAVLPTPTLSVSGKICSASLSITPFGIGLGGGCSPENIGTGTRRIVSGRIVSESSL